MVNILKDVRSITHREGESLKQSVSNYLLMHTADLSAVYRGISLEQKRSILSIEAVPQTRLRYTGV